MMNRFVVSGMMIEQKRAYLLERWKQTPRLHGTYARAWRAWNEAIRRNQW